MNVPCNLNIGHVLQMINFLCALGSFHQDVSFSLKIVIAITSKGDLWLLRIHHWSCFWWQWFIVYCYSLLAI